MSDSAREKQVAEAEAILGDRLEETSFAKGLFFGKFHAEQLPDYPDLRQDETLNTKVDRLSQFCKEEIDPVAIDLNKKIPDAVIHGLGKIGMLGACLPEEVGGAGLGQIGYCRLLEILGAHCGSTALFVNAHHSIGPRAIVLFGTPEQQQKFLPKTATGEWISAFALTEPEAGSDAANVQTTATPLPDGSGFKINGEKRWITNGGIAQVLTVMARTPTKDGNSKITAFLVTPDMPGFEVVEKRMEKCGVRGTATSRLAFHDMFVPKENVLGPLGQGLKVALTVLDYGRTTFGASCTGAAKFCVARTAEHANQRVQFDKTLGQFELVKAKLARMQAAAFAIEACTYQTAAIIDEAKNDFMIETAMLKVFSTDALWSILDDAFQIHGGLAYFADQPFERMMRDARINTIGEGANDVLRGFVALVGMRDVGLELESMLHAMMKPIGRLGTLFQTVGHRIAVRLSSPTVEVRSMELEKEAAQIGRLIGQLARCIESLLARYREAILDRQYHLARIADSATELYVCACVLRRLDFVLSHPDPDNSKQQLLIASGRYYLQTAFRRIRENLRHLRENDDDQTTQLANRLLNLAKPAE